MAKFTPTHLPQKIAFWREWPPGRQRRVLHLLIGAALLGCVLIWYWLHAATLRAGEQAMQAMDQHVRVAAFVQEIQNLEQTRGQIQSGAPALIAARQISQDLNLEDKLVSVRPAMQAAGRDGVQLYYERLNLTELLALLEAMGRHAGLQTSTLTFNRRLDNPSLADLQLVLFR